MTAAKQRTLGRVLIGLALLVIIVQELGMLRFVPKLAPGNAGSALFFTAVLVALVGQRLYRRGSRQPQ